MGIKEAVISSLVAASILFCEENNIAEFLDNIRITIKQMQRMDKAKKERSREQKKKKEARKKLIEKLAFPSIFRSRDYTIKYHKEHSPQNSTTGSSVKEKERRSEKYNKSQEEVTNKEGTGEKNGGEITYNKIKHFIKKNNAFNILQFPSLTRKPPLNFAVDSSLPLSQTAPTENNYLSYLPIYQWYTEVIKSVYSFWAFFDKYFVSDERGFKSLKEEFCKGEIDSHIDGDYIFNFKLSQFLSSLATDYSLYYYSQIFIPLRTNSQNRYNLYSMLSKEPCEAGEKIPITGSICWKIAALDKVGQCYVYTPQRKLGDILDDCKKKGKCEGIRNALLAFYRHLKRYLKQMEEVYISLLTTLYKICATRCECAFINYTCNLHNSISTNDAIMLLIYLLQKDTIKTFLRDLEIAFIKLESFISQLGTPHLQCKFTTDMKLLWQKWQQKYKNITISRIGKLLNTIAKIEKSASEGRGYSGEIVKEIEVFYKEYKELSLSQAITELQNGFTEVFLRNYKEDLCNYYALKSIFYSEVMGEERRVLEIERTLNTHFRQLIGLLNKEDRQPYLSYMMWDIYKEKIKDEVFICTPLKNVTPGTVSYSLEILERMVTDPKCIASLIGIDYSIPLYSSGLKPTICVGQEERYFYPKCLHKDFDGKMCYIGCLLNGNTIIECLQNYILVQLCIASVPPFARVNPQASEQFLNNCTNSQDKIETAKKSVVILEEFSAKMGISLKVSENIEELISRMDKIKNENKVNFFPALENCCNPYNITLPACGFNPDLSKITDTLPVDGEEIKCADVLYYYLNYSLQNDINTLCPTDNLEYCNKIDKQKCQICFEESFEPLQCSEGCNANQPLKNKCKGLIRFISSNSVLLPRIKNLTGFCSLIKTILSNCWTKVEKKITALIPSCNETLLTIDIKERRNNYITQLKKSLGNELFNYLENNRNNLIPPEKIKCE